MSDNNVDPVGGPDEPEPVNLDPIAGLIQEQEAFRQQVVGPAADAGGEAGDADKPWQGPSPVA